jgi:hypothetical protein
VQSKKIKKIWEPPLISGVFLVVPPVCQAIIDTPQFDRLREAIVNVFWAW